MRSSPYRAATAAAIALSIATPACDKGSDAPTTARSEQVTATGTMPTAAPEAAAPSAHPAATRPHARLCDGDGNARGRAVSKGTLAHVEAQGAAPLDGTIGRGTWTWINFWAAWCGPCKEEMGRLLSWQDKLGKAGTPVRFVFVSLDDDRRQLEQFLAQQPDNGLKSSLWLPESSRAGWLGSLRMKSSPELPEQALVDPSGKVRCFIEGAVDDSDYAEVAGIVGATR